MKIRRFRSAVRWAWLVLANTTLLPSAYANGEAELVAPVDAPVSATPGRPLPFPVALEPAPRGTPSAILEALPGDAIFLTTSNFGAGSKHDNALGQKRECFESVVLRGTSIGSGKISIPAGGLGYVSEAWPGALPFRQDVLCIAGEPNTLVDFEQTIVTRKNVLLTTNEAQVLGSEIFRLRSVTEFGDARSAVIEVSALSGFDWARLGTGSLEVSTTEPGWHAKTFHYGLHQGRVDEVTPTNVRFAWLSGLRTDWVVLAAKREFSGKLSPGADASLGSGGRIHVVRIDPTRKEVSLETPEGPKTLSANADLRGLPADTSVRKKLIAVGAKYAVVLVPEASDFAARQIHVEVYSELHQYRHGDLAAEERAFKTYPIAHYTGAVLGVFFTNDAPIELTKKSPTLEGPQGSFKVRSSWNASGALESFQLEDSKGTRSAAIPLAGRQSINFVGGAGPTLDSVLARVGASSAARLHDVLLQSSSKTPAPSPVAATAVIPPVSARDVLLNPSRHRTIVLWALLGLALGFLLGVLIGRIGRRRAFSHR